jgi:hypothetical protein
LSFRVEHNLSTVGLLGLIRPLVRRIPREAADPPSYRHRILPLSGRHLHSATVISATSIQSTLSASRTRLATNPSNV